MKKILLSSLLTFALFLGCQDNSNLNLSIEENNNNAIEALDYKQIGGKSYNDFKISPKLPKVKEERKATKVTYLMTDDEAHQSPWSGKMVLFMDDLPQKNVHNVVFRDGGKEDDSLIYYLQGGKDAEKIESPYSLLQDNIKEVQSNNPKVFSEILEWSFDNYPAKKRYLQIYTHGGGVLGIGMDAHQTNTKGEKLGNDEQISMITPQNFAEALRQALKGRKLELIYFRACLMSNVEALYELRDIVKYTLASEDVSYSKENSNITMTKLLDDLVAKDLDAKDIAYQMAVQGLGKSGSKNGYTTFAAIDISKMDELKSAINSLSLALISGLKTEKEAILSAYDAVPTVQGESEATKSSQHMRDIWRFTGELDKKVTSKSIKDAIQLVRKAQKSVMIHERDSFGDSANGLSIFMPFRQNLKAEQGMYKFLNNGYLNRRFAKDSAWTKFLQSLPTT
ncbi:MAG: clostripain-related cysteine peptidase [Candidatus Sericytochromatia bacterium]